MAFTRRIARNGRHRAPDAFYTRFFESLLRQGAGRGAAQIREALQATRRSPFTVFSREVPLS